VGLEPNGRHCNKNARRQARQAAYLPPYLSYLPTPALAVSPYLPFPLTCLFPFTFLFPLTCPFPLTCLVALACLVPLTRLFPLACLFPLTCLVPLTGLFPLTCFSPLLACSPLLAFSPYLPFPLTCLFPLLAFPPYLPFPPCLPFPFIAFFPLLAFSPYLPVPLTSLFPLLAYFPYLPSPPNLPFSPYFPSGKLLAEEGGLRDFPKSIAVLSSQETARIARTMYVADHVVVEEAAYVRAEHAVYAHYQFLCSTQLGMRMDEVGLVALSLSSSLSPPSSLFLCVPFALHLSPCKFTLPGDFSAVVHALGESVRSLGNGPVPCRPKAPATVHGVGAVFHEYICQKSAS
jgi:hypothetical protein